MSIEVELTPAALSDVRAAYAWYEDRRAGLGVRFLRSLEECLDAVSRNPESFEVVYKQYHRKLIRKFPNVVFYKFESDRVKVY